MSVNADPSLMDRIKSMRLVHEMSRAEFSSYLGMSFSTFKNYEAGYREPSWTFFKRVHEVLGKPWLLYLVDCGKQPKVKASAKGVSNRKG